MAPYFPTGNLCPGGSFNPCTFSEKTRRMAEPEPADSLRFTTPRGGRLEARNFWRVHASVRFTAGAPLDLPASCFSKARCEETMGKMFAGGALCGLVSLGVCAFACTSMKSSPSASSRDTETATGSHAKGEEGSMGVLTTTPTVTATAAASAATGTDKGGVGAYNGPQGQAGVPNSRPAAPPPYRYGMPADGKDPGAGFRGDTLGGVVDLAPVQAPKLDPNARYATTYRPGGAAL